MDTNIEAAFMLILNTAIRNRVPQYDMPKSIVIISDMQFNASWLSTKYDFYDDMKTRFEQYGYYIPNIVFWNVNSTKNVFHVQSNYKGVQLASGQSAAVFKDIIKNAGMNPYEAMMNVLNSDRYKMISA